MPGLTAQDIVTDHEAYARQRPEVRARMIPLRQRRRVRLGDMLLLEFENAETLRYQVQEMVYVERLAAPTEVADEVAAYARLLPTSHELCATMFLEVESAATAQAELAALDGIQHAVSLSIGGVRVPGRELPGLDEIDAGPLPTVSVHVLRFALADAQRDAFRDPAVPVELSVDHPAYRDAAPIDGETRRALIADLALRD